ncbi:N-acetylneuraminate synthase family protein [Thiorhodovibrio frisius]|uniref:Sialic acid synthase n=1 Tax=Thiorhodovibrio frisius TaxID=631362 RepID=H8Z0A4_9GAMM|nr:N-acetylneuraminate synthase family protein [Thiorhodovibrio frisius]EIC22312.1 sialic acid synthase [Thiorhodovibrio frisius]WPL24609.1 Spore coat polysaccharide biosynthesis protein SpsE [Thiorhodovibrio frisius]
MKLTEIIVSPNAKTPFPTPPYLIAEAGVNHEGNMDLAYRLINEAKEGGADAIKFQTYKAETLAAKESPAYWDLTQEPTPSQYELFQKYDKFWKTEYEALARHCQTVGIEFLSTPFDLASARFLNDLMSVFKIASSDLNNKPLIDALCSYGKPILLSTGAAHLWEIEQTLSWIDTQGNPVALLHCILNYPTEDSNANLAMIPTLARKFPERVIGYSDHTLPKDMKTLEVATLLGAQILEKHFTYDKTRPGNDHYHAMDKADLQRFHGRMNRLLPLLGNPRKQPLPSEAPARAYARRSLVAARAIPAGKRIDPADLTWKRPATGIDPRDYDQLLGQMAAVEIAADHILQWNLFRD